MREPHFSSDGIVEEDLFVRAPPRIPRKSFQDTLQPRKERRLSIFVLLGGIAVPWGIYELVRWVWRLAAG